MSQYAVRMSRLAARIFGEVARPTNSQSMKVVQIFSEKPRHMRPDIVDYYPRHRDTYILMKELRWQGLYRDEHEDFKEEMKRLRRLRGKGKPVKGEGKRATRRQ